MAKDTGLNNDSCIFLEAVSGDGGNHTAPVWWMSDDITGVGVNLANPLSAGAHQLQVTTHRKAGNCTTPGNADGAIVELYLCIPGPVMNPTDASVVAPLGQMSVAYGAGANQLAPGGTANSIFNINIANSGTGPLSPGHKCLVARSYPNDGVTASNSSLAFLPEDQHYAQRNLCIIQCNSPCGTELQTTNPDRERGGVFTLRVVADLKPTRFVQERVLKSLQQVKGFKQLAPTPPPPFKLALRDLPNAIIKENLRPSEKGWYGRFKAPNVEAKFELKPRQSSRFRFETDLAKTDYGNAHIYHLVQLDAQGKTLGGVTLVTVRRRK